jgi:hypothetical protein
MSCGSACAQKRSRGSVCNHLPTAKDFLKPNSPSKEKDRWKSSSDYTPLMTIDQAQTGDPPGIDHEQRFYKVYADIGEFILAVITGDLFCHFAARVCRLIQGQWLPDSGAADLSVLTALLDKSESTVRQMARRINAPLYKPGDTNMYRFADFQFRPPAELESPAEPSPSSAGVAPRKKPPKT